MNSARRSGRRKDSSEWEQKMEDNTLTQQGVAEIRETLAEGNKE